MNRRAFLQTLLLVVCVFAGAVGIVIAAERSDQPPGQASGSGASARPPGGALLLAGSGSNLPLTRLLVEAWKDAEPGVRAEVLSSIGSGGGLQALSDGAIDIALVSRPLRPGEGEGGEAIPYARAGIVVATRLPLGSMDVRQLGALYEGESLRGRRVVPILREEGDSTFAVLAASDEGFAAAIRSAQSEERFMRVFTDRAMEHALTTVDGALGLLDFGFLQAQGTALNAVPLGPLPTPEVLARGDYPYTKDLLLVVPVPATPAANAFLAFTRSETGQAIIRRAAYLPLRAGR